jgi:hypothetical protein
MHSVVGSSNSIEVKDRFIKAEQTVEGLEVGNWEGGTSDEEG